MNYQDGGNNNDELDISDAESDVSDLPPMSSSQQQSQNVALNNISRPDLSSSSLSGIFRTAEDPGKWFKPSLLGVKASALGFYTIGRP